MLLTSTVKLDSALIMSTTWFYVATLFLISVTENGTKLVRIRKMTFSIRLVRSYFSLVRFQISQQFVCIFRKVVQTINKQDQIAVYDGGRLD